MVNEKWEKRDAYLKKARNRANDPPPTPGNSFIAPGFFQYLKPSLSPFGAPPRSMTRPQMIKLNADAISTPTPPIALLGRKLTQPA